MRVSMRDGDLGDFCGVVARRGEEQQGASYFFSASSASFLESAESVAAMIFGSLGVGLGSAFDASDFSADAVDFDSDDASCLLESVFAPFASC